MEKYKLIQKRFGISFFAMLIVLIFNACQPLVFSEEDVAAGGNVKPVGHDFTLKPKESFEIRNGKIAYNEHCAPCHGNTGKGDGKYYASSLEPKPRNFTDTAFMNQVHDEYLIEVIKKGTAAFGKSPYCPPWGDTLKEDEKVRNIISFLRTLAVK
ncbi:MAG: c-type cytochrome [Candidatus Scalindua sp.]